jgi:hypothetical protein
MSTSRKTQLIISLVAGLAAVGLTWIIMYCDPSWRESADRASFILWNALNVLPTRLAERWGDGAKPLFCILIFAQWFILVWVVYLLAEILKSKRRSKKGKP